MASFYMIKNSINFFGRIIASAYSRRREFGADRIGSSNYWPFIYEKVLYYVYKKSVKEE